MNKWQETIKRVSKQHPGKSLTYILPIAKVEYRKMGHVSTKSVKKGRKGRKGRKGHKGHKGRRTMKGGSSCASASAGASVGASVQGGTAVDNVDGGGVAAFDGNWSGEDSLITGGSKRRGSKRRGRGSKRSGSKRRGRGSKRGGSKRGGTDHELV